MTEPSAPTAELLFEDNREESRYEAWLGDRMVGIAEYELADESGPIVFVHTEVLPGAEGMGVGRGLARAAPERTPCQNRSVRWARSGGGS